MFRGSIWHLAMAVLAPIAMNRNGNRNRTTMVMYRVWPRVLFRGATRESCSSGE